ncbi:MAG: N-terminal phage integrase SAM-like domain-containing protein [Actinomycetota bacterium]|nr:N-terminal phage integrase SAM-like domain-containing protein [Actinomycetota bacterium]
MKNLGRYQASHLGPDGQRRYAEETFERKGDADRALSLIESEIVRGEWTDPERAKVTLAEYAATWIDQHPRLRPRSADQYRWLLRKHIAPRLGGVPIGKLSTAMIREWRASLLAGGVSVSVAAKAYRLLRAVLMTAVDEDGFLPRNPCRIRGAGDEGAAERPVLTVAQVFELAKLVGRRPVGNIRALPAGGYRLRFSRHGEMRTSPEVFATRPEAERALWKMADDGGLPPGPAVPRPGPAHHLRQPALRRGNGTAPLRSRPDCRHGAGARRIRRVVDRRNPARPAQVTSWTPRHRHPGGDHPGPARAPVDLRQARRGRARLHRREGRADAAQQLQQDVGLAARGELDWRRGPARSRSSPHGKHVRRVGRLGHLVTYFSPCSS